MAGFGQFDDADFQLQIQEELRRRGAVAAIQQHQAQQAVAAQQQQQQQQHAALFAAASRQQQQQGYNVNLSGILGQYYQNQSRPQPQVAHHHPTPQQHHYARPPVPTPVAPFAQLYAAQQRQAQVQHQQAAQRLGYTTASDPWLSSLHHPHFQGTVPHYAGAPPTSNTVNRANEPQSHAALLAAHQARHQAAATGDSHAYPSLHATTTCGIAGPPTPHVVTGTPGTYPPSTGTTASLSNTPGGSSALCQMTPTSATSNSYNTAPYSANTDMSASSPLEVTSAVLPSSGPRPTFLTRKQGDSIVVTDGEKEWYMGVVPLGLDDDRFWLSELQVYLRSVSTEVLLFYSSHILRNVPVFKIPDAISCFFRFIS
jgi:hypothetical protein